MAHKETRSVDEVQGWIVPLLQTVLETLSAGSILVLGTERIPPWLPDSERIKVSEKRARQVDNYIATCLVLDFVCLFVLTRSPGPILWWMAVLFVCWRILDSLSSILRVSLFDNPLNWSETEFLSSPARVVVLGLLDYFELVLCFACIYASAPHLLLHSMPTEWWLSEAIERPLHLSFMTQSTVGYGDVLPSGWLRPVTWIQSFAGVGVIALLIARFLEDVSPKSRVKVGSKSENRLPD